MNENFVGALTSIAGLTVVTLAVAFSGGKETIVPPPPRVEQSAQSGKHVFTTPTVVARRARSAQDTLEWHVRACKEDINGYDCRLSASMLRDDSSDGTIQKPRRPNTESKLGKLKM